MATSSGRNRPVAAVSRSSGPRCARPTGRSEQLTRRLGALCLAERDLRDPAHQLRIVPAGDLRHAGEPGVVVQIWIGVDLEHPGPPLVVDAEIDAAVALSLHGPPGELGEPDETVVELLRDAGRSMGSSIEGGGGGTPGRELRRTAPSWPRRGRAATCGRSRRSRGRAPRSRPPPPA